MHPAWTLFPTQAAIVTLYLNTDEMIT